MKRGKATCEVLKTIRQQIAQENGIKLETSECQYKGDCTGTCPKCEAEVRYLEVQLNLRYLTGTAVTLKGIAQSMETSGDNDEDASEEEVTVLQGDIFPPEEDMRDQCYFVKK